MRTRTRIRLCGGLLASLLAAEAYAAVDPAAPFDQAVSRAEASLQQGEPQAAESQYRAALVEAWLLLGTMERLDGRLPEAREAFRTASVSAVENRAALQSLALVDLQMGEAAEAVSILRPLLDTPDDLELSFALARGYLDLKKFDLAVRLLEEILAARPIPQTNILVGRTYSDFELYDRARTEFMTALKRDPRTRRAHYYLGMVALGERRQAGLEEAAAEFQAELKLAPDDPLANRELGVVLVDLQRAEAALGPLEIAAREQPAPARVLYYLGRAQLANDRPAEAAASLKRALQGAQEEGASGEALRVIHIQLGQALRRLGQAEEAAAHFAEAERMTRRLAGSPGEVEAPNRPALLFFESSPLTALAPSQRLEIKRRVTTGLARVYLNLGVMRAQGQRFAHAAEMFEKAAEVDPEFPKVQSSLGVAYFNAKQFDKATGPLGRALETTPDPGLGRLLAMAWLNTQTYDKAAELLESDPERLRDPSLQFAYGLALVKSGRAAEAERIFSGLVTRNADSAELNVLLGQANAAQGDFDSAIARLQRALELKPDVPEANSALGVIYFKQGRMAEAEVALRAELAVRPDDLRSQQNLAAVLESQQKPEEALGLLRGVLRAKPDFADARYLLGKILLAQGDAEGAVPHLEAAVRLSPQDAFVHYQLGRAYQKLGRAELAAKELEAYRQIKEKRR